MTNLAAICSYVFQPLFYFGSRDRIAIIPSSQQSAEKFNMIRNMVFKVTHLNTDGEIVLLDPLKVQRVVDFDIRVGFPVLMPRLEVERVVLVGLVSRPTNQVVKHRRVVLDAGAAGKTGISINTRNRRGQLCKCVEIWDRFMLKGRAGTFDSERDCMQVKGGSIVHQKLLEH